MPIEFECEIKKGKKVEKWLGLVTNITNFGSHYELKIESKSGFIIIVGKTNYGNFICIPDYNIGCHLSTLQDLFWNTERLLMIMNKVDGITVAHALKAISGYIDFN